MNSLPVQVTPRDQEVLDALMTGAANKQIGESLNMAERTVKQHLRSVFIRMGLVGGERGKRAKLVRLLATSEQATGRKVDFTAYELRIAFLLGDGAKTNKEIAALCGLQVGTVRNKLRIMFDKSGVWNRQEFILWWQSHSWMYSQSYEAHPA